MSIENKISQWRSEANKKKQEFLTGERTDLDALFFRATENAEGTQYAQFIQSLLYIYKSGRFLSAKQMAALKNIARQTVLNKKGASPRRDTPMPGL